jgi:hypothetical protein
MFGNVCAIIGIAFIALCAIWPLFDDRGVR